MERSSGSPVLNEDSHKVIGIHLGSIRDKNYNKGSFLNYAIKKFIEDFNKTENNENISENTIIDENEQKNLIKQSKKNTIQK